VAPYFGAVVGRVANRIGGAQFTLDGMTHKLAANNGLNTLHGGLKGFDKVLWKGEVVEAEDGPAVKLTYHSKDGEEGEDVLLLCLLLIWLTCQALSKFHQYGRG
jgi:aldose 1-epimerase